MSATLCTRTDTSKPSVFATIDEFWDKNRTLSTAGIWNNLPVETLATEKDSTNESEEEAAANIFANIIYEDKLRNECNECNQNQLPDYESQNRLLDFDFTALAHEWTEMSVKISILQKFNPNVTIHKCSEDECFAYVGIERVTIGSSVKVRKIYDACDYMSFCDACGKGFCDQHLDEETCYECGNRKR